MKPRIVAVALAGLIGTQNVLGGCSIHDTTNAQNATVFSILYGLPLLGAFSKAAPRIISAVGTNSYHVGRDFDSVNSTNVTRPSADLLYSQAVYDLCTSNLKITVPSVPDGRFWDISFFDPFGNNYANLGSLFNTTPGEYILSQSHVSDQQVVSTTMQGTLLIRLLAVNTTEDLAIAHQIQDGFALNTIPRADAQRKACISNATWAGLGLTTASIPQDIMTLTARLALHNPPEVQSDRACVALALNKSGIDTVKGTYVPPDSVDIDAAWTSAEASLLAFPTLPGSYHDAGNSWFLPALAGDYRSDYLTRAFVAAVGPYALTPDVALYPSALSVFSLAANEAIIVTFSGRPDVRAFWSLTMYNPDGTFVPNPINRYAIGDRSNLTYPDGTPVYPPGNTEDQTFQVLLQSADIPPPMNWTNNWLPTPAGGGNFTMNLRFYGPTDSLSNGQYIYPLISTVMPAITAN